jgi:hypothetical protein
VPAPDYFEPTLGWRAWLVVETRDGLRLSSVLYPTLWAPRDEEVAVCRPVDPRADDLGHQAAAPPPHAAPHPHCGCGIYASKKPELVMPYVHSHAGASAKSLIRVMGKVSLWGTVIETEHGYRASHAYPVRLYIPLHRIQRRCRITPASVAYDLMTTYGVEVVPAAMPRDASGPIVRTRRKRADATAPPPMR